MTPESYERFMEWLHELISSVSEDVQEINKTAPTSYTAGLHYGALNALTTIKEYVEAQE
jgi:hypothetical protein